MNKFFSENQTTSNLRQHFTHLWKQAGYSRNKIAGVFFFDKITFIVMLSIVFWACGWEGGFKPLFLEVGEEVF